MTFQNQKFRFWEQFIMLLCFIYFDVGYETKIE